MKYYNKLLSLPLVYFVTHFIVFSTVSILLIPYITNVYRDIYVDMGNRYFERNINSDFSLQRKVEIKNELNNQQELRIYITYYDKKSSQGDIEQKFIAVNIINEGLIPVFLVVILSLSMPFPFRRKLLPLLLGIVLINLYVFFKLFAIAYDNYNTPEYFLTKLSFIISGIVYYFNYILNIAGFGINLIISVIIFAITTIRLSDLEKLRAYFQKH